MKKLRLMLIKLLLGNGLFIRGGSKKHLQENIDKLRIEVREKTINEAIDIIDGHKYSMCWSEKEKLWNDRIDGIKAEIATLKG